MKKPSLKWLGASLQVVALLALLVSLALLMGHDLYRYLRRTRGVEEGTPAAHARLDGSRLGVNVALEGYQSDDALRRALAMVRAAGLGVIRQRFSWMELEPEPGSYRWERWDRVLPLVEEYGLKLIAVLDTSPGWARPGYEADNPWAPPISVEDYARFAHAFARRYGHVVAAYQIWDEPNIHPHWGKGAIDPAAYVNLLRAGSEAIRSADVDALIVAGGLAPNTEEGGRNMSDVTFLREIYRRGAGRYFDVLGVKAYGFWSGPDDRRVDPRVLNFSRVILLREEMVRRGEGKKPLWALEGGWCALPSDWQGNPSPQGSDEPFVQAERLGRALVRIQREWPWMKLACLAHLQPYAVPEDPIWGYALFGPQGEPTLAWERLRAFLNQGLAQNLSTDYQAWRRRLFVGLLVGTLAIAWCIWALRRTLRELHWRQAWGWVRARWLGTPTWLQGGALCFFGCAAVLSPWLVVRMMCLALYVLSALLRPDLALLVAVFCIPLAPVRISLGQGMFSLTELSLLVAVGARLWERLSTLSPRDEHLSRRSFGLRLDVLDWAVLLMVLLGLGTSFFAEYRRVAFREWRTVVLESALMYGLVRAGGKGPRSLLQFVDVLWLSAVCVALYALARYPFAEGVIEAEGVRRARAFYGSPNNLALYLERLLPLGVTFVAWGKTRWRRWAYGFGGVAIGSAILLTFSRGAWLLGMPAMLGVLAWMLGKRTRWIVLGVLLVGLLVLVALAGPARLRSLTDFSRGTTFLRLSVWQAAWAMVRDHPWLGVGLDNFLYYYGDYIRPGAEVDRWLSHPHNLILDFWLRLGVGGVMLVLGLLAGFAWKAWRAYHALPSGDLRAAVAGFMAGMVVCVVHGLIDSSFFVVELAFWFMIALGWVVCLGRDAGALSSPASSSILAE